MRTCMCLLLLACAAPALAGGYTLCSPHTEDGDLYKGQLHCHSARSDGKQSAEVVLRAYGGVGYDFVALSDHLVVGADPGVGGITWIPSSEVHTKAAERDKGWGGQHIGAFGIQGDPKTWDREGAQAILRRIDTEKGVSAAFHPRLRNRWSIERLTEVEGLSLISIFNGRGYAQANAMLPGSGSSLYAANAQWDAVSSRGRFLWGIATDDCHDVTDLAGFDQGWVLVRARSRAAGDLLDALRRGDFVACRGPSGASPTLTVRATRDPDGEGWQVFATSDEGVAVRWVGKAGPVAEGKGSVRYTPRGDEGFLRAVALGAQDARTYGQPIQVVRGPKVVATAGAQRWTISFQDADGRPVSLRRPLTLSLAGDPGERFVVGAGQSSFSCEGRDGGGRVLTPDVESGWPAVSLPE